MIPIYSSLWSLLKTHAGDDSPAIIYAGADDKKKEISYRLFYTNVKKAAEVLKRKALPVPVACKRDMDSIITIIANLIAGNDVLMLDENGTIPDGFENAQAPASEDPVTRGTFHEGVPEGRALFFTSGTTSSSKAVILSTRALLRACYNGQSLSPCGEGDIILSVLPLSHVFGFICSFLWGLSYGSAIALGRSVHELFNDPDFFTPTIISAVPSMADVFVKAGCLNPELRLMIIGAAPCSPETIAALTEKGVEVHSGYGLTETASGIALHSDDTDPLALTPCPDADISIADDGEILVSTESMMDGYLGGGTEEVLKDGTLYTGDFGFLDESGNLHVTGRKKDMLVLASGTKVFLPEYEGKLAGIIGKCDMAVIQSGPKLLLFIGDPLPAGALAADISDGVERFNNDQPRDMQISDIIYYKRPLPRGSTGKVRRYLLNG